MKLTPILFSLLALLLFGFSSFDRAEDIACNTEAQIIYFEAKKCGCCWGWRLKVGNDTIMVKSMPDPHPSFLYPSSANGPVYFKEPLKVLIGIGELEHCYNKYPYFKITCIELAK